MSVSEGCDNYDLSTANVSAQSEADSSATLSDPPESPKTKSGTPASANKTKSSLDNLSREDLVKFVKKQTILLQKSKQRCDELNNTISLFEKRASENVFNEQQEKFHVGADDEVELLRNKCKSLEEVNRQLLEELSTAEANKNHLNQKYESTQRSLNNTQVDHENTKQELYSLRERFESANSEIEDLKAEKEMSNFKIQELSKLRSKMEAELADSKLEIERVKEAFNAKQERCGNWDEVVPREDYDMINEQLKIIKEKLSFTIKASDELSLKYATTVGENEKRSGELLDLKRALEEMTLNALQNDSASTLRQERGESDIMRWSTNIQGPARAITEIAGHAENKGEALLVAVCDGNDVQVPAGSTTKRSDLSDDNSLTPDSSESFSSAADKTALTVHSASDAESQESSIVKSGNTDTLDLTNDTRLSENSANTGFRHSDVNSSQTVDPTNDLHKVPNQHDEENSEVLKKLAKAQAKAEEWETIVDLLRCDLERTGRDLHQSQANEYHLQQELECVQGQLEEALCERDSLRDDVCRHVDQDESLIGEQHELQMKMNQLLEEGERMQRLLNDLQALNEEKTHEIGNLVAETQRLAEAKSEVEKLNDAIAVQMVSLEERERNYLEQLHECKRNAELHSAKEADCKALIESLSNELQVKNDEYNTLKESFVTDKDQIINKLRSSEQCVELLTQDLSDLTMHRDELRNTLDKLLSERHALNNTCGQPREEIAGMNEQFVAMEIHDTETEKLCQKYPDVERFEVLVEKVENSSSDLVSAESPAGMRERGTQTENDPSVDGGLIKYELSTEGPEHNVIEELRIELNARDAEIEELREEKNILARTVEKLEMSLECRYEQSRVNISRDDDEESCAMEGDWGASENSEVVDIGTTSDDRSGAVDQLSASREMQSTTEIDRMVPEQIMSLKSELGEKEKLLDALLEEKENLKELLDRACKELSSRSSSEEELFRSREQSEILRSRIHELTKENEQNKEELIEATSCRVKAENEVDSLSGQLAAEIAEFIRFKEKNSDDIEILRDQYETAERRLSELDKLLDDARDDADLWRREAETLREDMEQCKQEVDWTRQKMEKAEVDFENRLHELDDEANRRESKLEEKLNELSCNLERARNRNKDLTDNVSEKQGLMNDLEACKKEISDMQTCRDCLVERVKDLETKESVLETERDDLIERLTELKNNNEKMTFDFEESKTELEKLCIEKEQKLNDYNQKESELLEEVASLKSRLEFVEEEKATVVADHFKSRTSAKELEELVYELRHENVNLQNGVQEMKEEVVEITSSKQNLFDELKCLKETVRKQESNVSRVHTLEEEVNILAQKLAENDAQKDSLTQTVTKLNQEREQMIGYFDGDVKDNLAVELKRLLLENANLIEQKSSMSEQFDQLKSQIDQKVCENAIFEEKLSASKISAEACIAEKNMFASEKDALQKSLEKMIDDFDSLKKEIDCKSAENEGLQNALNEKDDELERLKTIAETKKAELNKASLELSMKVEESQNFQEQLLQLKELLREADEQNTTMTDRFEEKCRQLRELSTEHCAAQESQVDSDQTVAGLETAVKERDDKIAKLKILAMKGRKELCEASSKLQVNEAENTKLTSELATSLQTIREKETALEQLQLTLDKQVNTCQTLHEELTNLQSAADLQKQELFDVKSQYNANRKELDDKSASFDQTVKDLGEKLVAVEKEKESERMLKEQLRSEKEQVQYRVAQMEENFRQQTEVAKKTLENHSTETKHLQAIIDSLREELHSAEREAKQSCMMDLEIADYERTVQSLQDQILTRDNALKTLESDKTILEESIASVRCEMESLEAQKSQADERSNKLKQLLMKRKKDLADSKQAENDHLQIIDETRNQLEDARRQIEELKIESSSSAARLRVLSDHVTHLQSNSQRSTVALETKLERAERELESLTTQCVNLQAEYDSYKVRVHNVLKQQKEQQATVLSDAEKAERENLDKRLEQMKLKLDQTCEKLSGAVATNHLLTDENERLLVRQTALTQEMHELQTVWKERLENLSAKYSTESSQQLHTIQNLTEQNHSITKTFKEQFRCVQETHQRSQAALQAHLNDSMSELASLRHQLVEQAHQRPALVTVQDGSGAARGRAPPVSVAASSQSFTDPALSEAPQHYAAHVAAYRPSEERQQGEGMEHSEVEPMTRHRSPPSLQLTPLEQLISSTVSDDMKDTTRPQETESEMLLRAELLGAGKRIEHLSELLNETEGTVMRLTEQSKLLKEEVRRLERNQEREQHMANMEYLKNIVFKFLSLSSGQERGQLVPVLTTMLKLSEAEKQILVSVAGGQESEVGGVPAAAWSSYFHRWSGLT